MKRLQNNLFFTLILLLPSQVGTHLWLPESLVMGRRVDYLSPAIYLTDLALLATGIVVFWTNRSRLRRHLRWLSLVVVIVVFLVAVSVARGQLLDTYMFLRLIKLVFFAGIILLKNPSLSEITWPLSIGVGYTVALAVSQFLLQRSVGGIFYFLGERAYTILTPAIAHLVAGGQLLLRPYATFPHPNVMGGYLATLLPLFLLTRHFEAKLPTLLPALSTRIKYFFHRSTTALLILGILLSFSRAAWVAAAGVSLIVVYSFSQSRKALLWGILGLVAVIIVEESFIGRLTSLITIDSQSWWQRQQLVEAAYSMFVSSPLLGVGWGRFIPALPHHSAPPFLLQPVHNVYLLILAETGMIGLLIFGLFIGICIKNILEKKRYSLLVALGVVLGLGLFDHYFVTIPQTTLLFSLIVSLSLARNGSVS